MNFAYERQEYEGQATTYTRGATYCPSKLSFEYLLRMLSRHGSISPKKSTNRPSEPSSAARFPQDQQLCVPSLSLQLLLMHLKRVLEQILFFLLMVRFQTRRDTGTGVPTGIHDVPSVVVFGLVQQGLDAGLHEAPAAGVQGLLLTPDNVLGVGITVEVFLELGPGEGVELFDTRDGDILEPLFLTVFDKGNVDLSGAHDDTLNLIVLIYCAGLMCGIGDDPLEVGLLGKVFDF